MEEATCEKIIKSVDSILRKDSELDEFGVIHTASEVNKSPVIHIDHKLGLESWCMKYTYKYAYSSILHYHNTGGYEYAESILRWTQFCLLIMPEVTTFWNIRKKMILKGLLKVDVDLLLSKLVLSAKPKCNEAFQHRRWLFASVIEKNEGGQARNNLVINNNVGVPANLQDFLWNELDICTWTANMSANNYHAWNHRLWVVKKLSLLGNVDQVLRVEYDNSLEWVSVHVSEHSGMHYRNEILNSISSSHERGNVVLEAIDSSCTSLKDLYLKELKLNEELMQAYPEHESLFYQRRVILLKLQYLFGNLGQRATSPPPPSYKRPCIETLNPEWTAIIQKELEMTDEGKCTTSHQLYLAQQHSNWVNNVAGY